MAESATKEYDRDTARLILLHTAGSRTLVSFFFPSFPSSSPLYWHNNFFQEESYVDTITGVDLTAFMLKTEREKEIGVLQYLSGIVFK